MRFLFSKRTRLLINIRMFSLRQKNQIRQVLFISNLKFTQEIGTQNLELSQKYLRFKENVVSFYLQAASDFEL